MRDIGPKQQDAPERPHVHAEGHTRASRSQSALPQAPLVSRMAGSRSAPIRTRRGAVPIEARTANSGTGLMEASPPHSQAPAKVCLKGMADLLVSLAPGMQAFRSLPGSARPSG